MRRNVLASTQTSGSVWNPKMHFQGVKCAYPQGCTFSFAFLHHAKIVEHQNRFKPNTGKHWKYSGESSTLQKKSFAHSHEYWTKSAILQRSWNKRLKFYPFYPTLLWCTKCAAAAQTAGCAAKLGRLETSSSRRSTQTPTNGTWQTCGVSVTSDEPIHDIKRWLLCAININLYHFWWAGCVIESLWIDKRWCPSNLLSLANILPHPYLCFGDEIFYILRAICTKQLGHLACHIPHPAQPLVPRLRFSSNKGHNGPGPRSNSRSLQWYLKRWHKNAFLPNWWLFFTDSLDNVSDYVSKLSTFEAPLVGLKTSTTGEPGAPPAANFVNNHGMPSRNMAFHNESKTNESSIKRHSLAFST